MKPGIYPDLDEATYHGDPDSLSASGMKLILKAPALYQYRKANPEHRDVFDFGTAAHRKVLGVGAEIVTVHADSWRTKAAQEARKEARAAGKVALLADDVAKVDAMAEKLAAHDLAMRLLIGGQPEVSAFWHDDEYDVTRRARFDYQPAVRALVDYKTAASADPTRLPKAVVDFGYDLQAAQYLAVAAGLDLDIDAFAFVFQEKEAPYLVTVCELDAELLARGDRLCREALSIYRDCRDTDHWPGYVASDEFTTIYAPRWAS